MADPVDAGRAGGAAGAGWSGGAAGPLAWCVLAPNPGPMTLDGTNTWMIGAGGAGGGIVVDPGPHHEAHLRRVLDLARDRGTPPTVTLLTHGHPDHAAGARRFAELSGTAVRALDPAVRLGDEGLTAGDVVSAGDVELEVVGTPGHTSDSLSFLIRDDGGLLTGDTVLGRGTTMVAYPDGRLDDYLGSLTRLSEMARSGSIRSVLPGHGPVLADPVRVLEGYLRHRRERLDQIRLALAAGARTPRQVVERVYADVDRILWPAAERSVRAQLEYLAES
jgi:glyoxylase-like metal-dependent hydrolase (beta-lactamase superfamily II)